MNNNSHSKASRTVGWGIIGTGMVARKMAIELTRSADATIKVVAGRDRLRTAIFAERFNIPVVAASTDELAARVDVDVVYIATPPSTHREIALKCIANGKAVLIEKPLAGSRADAGAIVAAARAAGVLAIEGMWTRFLPLIAEVRTRLANGVLGEIRSLRGSFGASNIVSGSDNQFSAEVGGGALLHRGVYPLNLAIDLLGRAELISSAATIGRTGVDEDVVAVLRHERGPITTICASLRAPLPNTIEIEGTRGRIVVTAPIFRPWQAVLYRCEPTKRGHPPKFEALRESRIIQLLHQHLPPARGERIIRRYDGNGYIHEADAVMTGWRQGHTESAIMPLDDSLHVASIIDAARSSWPGRES